MISTWLRGSARRPPVRSAVGSGSTSPWTNSAGAANSGRPCDERPGLHVRADRHVGADRALDPDMLAGERPCRRPGSAKNSGHRICHRSIRSASVTTPSRRRCSISSTLAVSAADISRARAALISLNRSGVAPSGQMQTTPSSRSGWATARCSARCPPHEWPATQACAPALRVHHRERVGHVRLDRERPADGARRRASLGVAHRLEHAVQLHGEPVGVVRYRRARRAVAAPARPCPRGRRPAPRRRWGSRSGTR